MGIHDDDDGTGADEGEAVTSNPTQGVEGDSNAESNEGTIPDAENTETVSGMSSTILCNLSVVGSHIKCRGCCTVIT